MNRMQMAMGPPTSARTDDTPPHIGVVVTDTATAAATTATTTTTTTDSADAEKKETEEVSHQNAEAASNAVSDDEDEEEDGEDTSVSASDTSSDEADEDDLAAFASTVMAELETWLERCDARQKQAQGSKKGSDSGDQGTVSAAQSHDDLADLEDLPALTEYVSNWTGAPEVTAALLERGDLQTKLLNLVPTLKPVPLLFLGASASENELQESVVALGVIDKLKLALQATADLVDAASVVAPGTKTGDVVHAVCTLIYIMGTDHSQNFTNLVPISTDPSAVRAFARVFTSTWSQGEGPLAELTMLAAVKLAASISDPKLLEDFVTTTQFPVLPAMRFEAKPSLRLACHLMQAYAAGGAAGRVLNQFPSILNTVMDAVQDASDASSAGDAGIALFNGTDSTTGSQAVSPFAKTLVDVFSRAPKYSRVWNGAYGALGNLCRYLGDEGLTYLRELKVHNLFHPLMHSSNPKDHPADAASIVANLIGHVEQHPLLKASDNIIGIVHTELEKAWANEDLEGRTSEPWEPLQGLANLSVNDSNKPLIANTCLNLVMDILESSRPKDRLTDKFAIKVIANLAVTNALCGQQDRILRVFKRMLEASSKAKEDPAHRTPAQHVLTPEVKQDIGLTIFRIERLNTMEAAAPPASRQPASVRRGASHHRFNNQQQKQKQKQKSGARGRNMLRATTLDAPNTEDGGLGGAERGSGMSVPTVTRVQVGGGSMAMGMGLSKAGEVLKRNNAMDANDNDNNAAENGATNALSMPTDTSGKMTEEQKDGKEEEEEEEEEVPQAKKQEESAFKMGHADDVSDNSDDDDDDNSEDDEMTNAAVKETDVGGVITSTDMSSLHKPAPVVREVSHTQVAEAAPEAGELQQEQQLRPGHIMLSYPWKHQSFMLRVRNALESHGYKVWMDVDHVAGSILESMSDGVEKADVIVMCLCEAYKTSTPCRTEGEYAYKLGKPIVPIRPEVYVPDGWLGALCANLLYVDFTTDDAMFWAAQQHMLLQQVGRYTQPHTPASSGVHPGEGSLTTTTTTTTSADGSGGKNSRGEKSAGVGSDGIDWRTRALSAEHKLRDVINRAAEQAASSPTTAHGIHGGEGGKMQLGEVLAALSRIEDRLNNPPAPEQGMYCRCCIS
ncbi:hypothetical protein PTSG_07010 [Salpingoeca rosetta]|uniref:TIR domain-containing protein n=1 Tax=Salpingoeca rosetta (strain ATCC 50818 / BSB-021) TaxID=946362 RepID=F2UDS7_SALR5|nr:uncharacterized protein PTSG_07010 [Salpingoeca rosetta]EGD74777.1 hypothetical protein PTSG_07010 [Salpingoeca rosetta]|eukprot:XP_004992422.1 hypothetical protein PTSG_07010 [Salpingoeca rosetta]